MSNTEQQIEQEIQDKGLTAPRLTPADIDSKIKAVEYILPRDVCKRDNAFLVAQLLSNNKISAELRKKAETKMTALLDELI